MMTNKELIENRLRIGNNIAEIRTKRKLTTEQLGAMAGLKQQNISRIEKGLYSTGIDLFYKIAKALNIDIKELF